MGWLPPALWSVNVPAQAPGVLVINTGAIRRNYAAMQRAASGADVAAVVKADAYGLGAAPVVEALTQAGCATFFVATVAEAAAVRAYARACIVYVLNGLAPGTALLYDSIGARPVLGSLDEVSEWVAHAERGHGPYPAALQIDTGMNRLGVAPHEVQAVAAHPDATRYIGLVMSHLACADEPAHPKNAAQLGAFLEASSAFPGKVRSLANSAGVTLGPDYHFDMVRAGIGLYATGSNRAVSLYGRIVKVGVAGRGETVGYGASHTLKRRTKIATVSVGYADGWMRSLSASDLRDGPAAYIDDCALPLLGRVSMDLTTYDATDVPEDLVSRGGFVELIGERMSVSDIARFADTIGYEVLTAIGHRYHRVYNTD